MFGLNEDATLKIFKYLDFYDAINCSETNKATNNFINSTSKLWKIFTCALRINNDTNPKESLKKFLASSLGKDEGEIKKEWSSDLRKKIRRLPFIENMRLSSPPYLNPITLFEQVPTPVRTLGFKNEFILCRPLTNNIKTIIRIYKDENGKSCKTSESYTKNKDDSYTFPQNTFLFTNEEDEISLCELIKEEIDKIETEIVPNKIIPVFPPLIEIIKMGD